MSDLSSSSSYLLAFKAGRAFRREGSNFVDPSPTKGAVALVNGEDGLLHFVWKNRTSGVEEEDLILFPSDASFVKVSSAPNSRIYVLKFSSSNQRHFFWMQDASPDRDEEFVANVNGLLQDPDYTLVWGDASAAGSSATGDASTSAAPPAAPATTTAEDTSAGSNIGATPEQLARIQAILGSMSTGGNVSAPELSLTDILTPANITPLFTAHPELVSTLFPHLPPDLPVPASQDAIQRIISSPQFRSSVANFDQALRTGLLGGLVRSLGLPEEAGTGIEPFLRAIQDQAGRESSGAQPGDNMQTD
ncbi:hypothetical protein HGRIS_005671 [Hohenbuehelia grisea]|uniref:Adhesion regulating molecule n=1 Tax=Hohenbuehelia grisea TaxID=104357 RepID=A0ABR3JZU0_9AGAR